MPSNMNPKRPTQRHIIQKMAEVGERILKATREKQSYIQGNSNKAISWFFCRNFAGQKDVFKVHGVFKMPKGTTTLNTLPSKIIMQNWRTDKDRTSPTSKYWVPQFYNNPKRNVKRFYLSGKEKATTKCKNL